MHERAAGDVNTVPLVFAGKMFFSKPDGDFMCSAQFISKNVLLTAAHCVRDDKSGDFWKNITFFLQYDKGHASAKYTRTAPPPSTAGCRRATRNTSPTSP